MAIYNEILAPRFSAMLQRLLSMKGEQAVKQLSGEIMAVFPMFVGREARQLEGWGTFGWATLIPAGAAGNFGVFRIRNPIGSNVVTVIEKVLMASGTAGIGNIFVDTLVADQSDLTTIAGPTALDARSSSHSATILSSKNNSVVTGTGTQIGIIGPFNANQTIDYIVTDIQEMPLLPGSFYDFGAPVAATPWDVIVMFRERVLEPSELRG